MTQTTNVDANGVFPGDRYQRMRKSAEHIAADESIVSADLPYNAEGLRAYVASIEQLGLLDRLTEHDANTVILLAVLDFTKGAERMAWRIYDLMQDEPTVKREDDDGTEVMYALICILRLLVGAFVEPNHQLRLRGLMLEIDDAHADLRHVAAEAEGGQDSRLAEAAANLLTAKTALLDAIEAL